MLKSLNIKNYRGFEHLGVHDLSNVNLIVGTNNSGKTSVLESAAMLLDGSDVAPFQSSIERGEFVAGSDSPRDREIDIRHLFHGHHLAIGNKIIISGDHGQPISMTYEIQPPTDDDLSSTLFEKDDDKFDLSTSMTLVVSKNQFKENMKYLLTGKGGVPYDRLRRLPLKEKAESPPVNIISSESLGAAQLSDLWDDIALTDAEEEINHVLQILEPKVERIAFLSVRQYRYSKSGIVVKIKGLPDRVPLGSLGDGIRRMLAISISIISSSQGYLMIDEIDTGLHHSVMTEMWKMVIQTAERLNVQIFATTHSLDCIRSLGDIQSQTPELCKNVRAHRIEKDLEKTITYYPDELSRAILQHAEIR